MMLLRQILKARQYRMVSCVLLCAYHHFLVVSHMQFTHILVGCVWNTHYCDVIMDAMASQIISFTIAYSTVYSGADQRKHQRSASLAFVTGEFPAEKDSTAENVSIWWRHHGRGIRSSLSKFRNDTGNSYVKNVITSSHDFAPKTVTQP